MIKLKTKTIFDFIKVKIFFKKINKITKNLFFSCSFLNMLSKLQFKKFQLTTLQSE